MKFVIAAGGTGGHLFPGLAVGEVLLKQGHQVMVLISEKEIDALATQGRSEFRIEKLPSIGMPKLLSPQILGFLRRFKGSLDECGKLYADFRPDAVLGMGGFTSTAPILAGRRLKVPTFVHESNAIPGKANRLNAWLVNTVLLGFADCQKHFSGKRCLVTGTPIRASLIERVEKAVALKAFGLEPGRSTLLVMGGSQGAQGINLLLESTLPRLKAARLQVIHLTGSQDENRMKQAYAQHGIPAFVAAFWHQMEIAYSAADFCIARSGAASLTELSHFALPSVLIPYPHAAEDHQTLNARIFDAAGAGIMLNERQTTPEILANRLLWFLEEEGRLKRMGERSAALAPSEAAERVVEAILRSVG